jgi:hypothetical protein
VHTNGKNFKGQFDDEVVLCFFRKHSIQIISRVFSIALLLFLLGLGLRFFVLLTSQTVFVSSLVVFAHVIVTYMIHRQFLAIFRYFLHTILITNYRIVDVDKSVFLRDSKDSVDLSSVQDIRKEQNGFFANVLDYGTLVIVLSGTHASVNIDLVPRPGYHFKKMTKVKQAVLEHRHARPMPLDLSRHVEQPQQEVFFKPPSETEEDYVELLEKTIN